MTRVTEGAHISGRTLIGENTPMCLDSTDPAALRQALPRCRKPAMINSITNEDSRFEAVLPLILEHKAKALALCISEASLPESADGRVAAAVSLVDRPRGAGVPGDDIGVDPCVFPISTSTGLGAAVLESVVRLRALYPEVHIGRRVSNVSFGLDAAIMDPCDEGVVARIRATEALAGRDESCMEYLQAFRAGLMDFTKPKV